LALCLPRGHNDEILDVAFNATGSKLVTASADGTARVYNTMTGACQSILVGHEGEISKVLWIRLSLCPVSPQYPWHDNRYPWAARIDSRYRYYHAHRVRHEFVRLRTSASKGQGLSGAL
jgi:hypothetical protein